MLHNLFYYVNVVSFTVLTFVIHKDHI